MTTAIIGIDPGINGAIGIIHGDEYDVYDIPVHKVETTTKTKTMVDLNALDLLVDQILSKYTNGDCESTTFFEAWIEKVSAMPGQGVTSMFSMGRTLGNLEMIMTAYHIPIKWVTPQKWKKEVIFGAGSNKLISVQKAKELFPLCKYETERGRKLDGRAEAMLIAEYGRRQTI